MMLFINPIFCSKGKSSVFVTGISLDFLIEWDLPLDVINLGLGIEICIFLSLRGISKGRVDRNNALNADEWRSMMRQRIQLSCKLSGWQILLFPYVLPFPLFKDRYIGIGNCSEILLLPTNVRFPAKFISVCCLFSRRRVIPGHQHRGLWQFSEVSLYWVGSCYYSNWLLPHSYGLLLLRATLDSGPDLSIFPWSGSFFFP